MANISKREVDKCLPKEALYFVWDDEIKGFCLLVYPNGAKSYAFQYRTPEGKTRRFTIGKHGKYTPDQARDKAKTLAAEIITGVNLDPVGHKQDRRDALTLGELLDKYRESAKFAEKAASTQVSDKGRLNGHLKPLIGRVIADQLRPEQVRRAFADIRDGKTARDTKTGFRGRSIVRGGEGAARMSIRLLRSALSWAIKEGYLTSNPAMGVEIGNDESRDTILESVDQYRALFDTLDKMQRELRLRPQVADAVRVLALTGARRGEVSNLRWSHVDLKRGVIVLPRTSHKTGRKTGKPREIALPAAAQAIIARIPTGQPDDYVFQPASGVGPIDLSKPWRAIRKEAGLPADIGLHGLRHSLASMMAVQGAQAAELMATLGHRQLSTTARYLHFAQDAKVALVERHTAGISAALEGRPANPVLPLKKQ